MKTATTYQQEEDALKAAADAFKRHIENWKDLKEPLNRKAFNALNTATTRYLEFVEGPTKLAAGETKAYAAFRAALAAFTPGTSIWMSLLAGLQAESVDAGRPHLQATLSEDLRRLVTLLDRSDGKVRLNDRSSSHVLLRWLQRTGGKYGAAAGVPPDVYKHAWVCFAANHWEATPGRKAAGSDTAPFWAALQAFQDKSTRPGELWIPTVGQDVVRAALKRRKAFLAGCENFDDGRPTRSDTELQDFRDRMRRIPDQRKISDASDASEAEIEAFINSHMAGWMATNAKAEDRQHDQAVQTPVIGPAR